MAHKATRTVANVFYRARKEVNKMVEPTKWFVDHAYYTKHVLMEKGPANRISYEMTLNNCDISDEQMGKLLDILNENLNPPAKLGD